MKTITFYVERIDESEGFVLVDFFTDKDYIEFREQYNPQGSDYVDARESTMVLIQHVDFDSVPFSEGDAFRIDKELFMDSDVTVCDSDQIVYSIAASDELAEAIINADATDEGGEDDYGYEKEEDDYDDYTDYDDDGNDRYY